MDDHIANLLERAQGFLAAAKAAGADSADAVAARSRSASIAVRQGAVENTDLSEADNMALRVFVDGKVASVSAASNTDPKMLAERAVAMAKVSPVDPYNGLADPADLATQFPDFDLYDDTQLTSEQLTQEALETEAAALSVQGVTNSSGGGASAGQSAMVLVASNGFEGTYRGSSYSRSISVIAGEGTKMERDYDYSSRNHYGDLDDCAAIGQRAGERAVKRTNPRKMPTQTVTAVFDPRVSRGILGHLAGAINGSSIARKSSFLQNHLGKQVTNAAITVIDDPSIMRRPGSRPFDGEGVAGERLEMVKDGVLQHWFLSTSIAKQLGLKTNGRGARGGSVVGASPTNLSLEPGDKTPEQLMAEIGTGFYVTEVIGQGVNLVTGEYSRGASGFWIENGQIAYPVSEVTIASNLKEMFMRMVAANDIDRHYRTAAPTLVIEGMMLAGS